MPYLYINKETMKETTKLKGVVRYELFDHEGNLKQEGKGCNIVTTQGDDYFVDQLSDASGGAVDLIALGTGTATVDKADTWVSGPFSANGSAVGTAGGVSAATNSGTPANLQYVGTFAAGYATQTGITRALLTNLDPSADGNGTPNGTTTFAVAHGTISPTVNKGASDTLVVTWDISFLGA
jgi:hypothetical protein